MTAGPDSHQLDPENPWPGLDSFEESAADYFHGREEERDNLLSLVAETPVTVFFGKSGLGKTSLLKAGLFPPLRKRHFLPVYIRLEFSSGAPAFSDQVRAALAHAAAEEGIHAPAPRDRETVWEYLHRADVRFWDARNYPRAPVLVFDQFEELFTLGQSVADAVERFKLDLGDLAENRIPSALAVALAGSGADATGLMLRRMPYKVVVTLREDYLPEIETWRWAIPSLGRVRVRLWPMRSSQALTAVEDTAPHLMDADVARRIVQFVAAEPAARGGGGGAGPDTTAGEGGRTIEPALLSLFCRELNERRKGAGKARFDVELIESAQQGIIGDYYRSCLEGMPDRVSLFIEKELITEKGFRNSYAKEDAVPAYLTEAQLESLITRRLLRLDERYGIPRIELTHDVLTRAVREHRDWRMDEEERKRTRELRRARSLNAVLLSVFAAGAMAAIVVMVILAGEALSLQRARKNLVAQLLWVRIHPPTGGSVQLGCVEDDKNCEETEPAHPFAPNGPFEIMGKEVTNRQFAAFIETVASNRIARWNHAVDVQTITLRRGELSASQFADHPAVAVTWFEADAFCAFVGGSLPTEDQWEYAARGGRSGLIYPWGSDDFTDQANVRSIALLPVGRFPAHGKLYDMSGNAAEWTSGFWAAPNKPEDHKSGGKRSVRGGSFRHDAEFVRISYRGLAFEPWEYSDFVGFRCLR